ncbi:MAG: carbohydrate ABC transporter permease [Clostridiales bacterium]|jgi:putative aldouronate transport system permease protein|nr:carbohydrate ABC transporter permease [Clostridiales bacterium]
MISRRIKKSVSDHIVDIVVGAIVVVVFFMSVYPFYLSVVLSFNEGTDAASGGIYFWPRRPTLDNYIQLVSDVKWIKAFAVTLSRTVLGTAMTVFFTTIVAYGLSHSKLIGRKIYMGILLVAMYVSGGIIPYYAVLKALGLMNSFAVYVVPGMLNLFYVLVSIAFFKAIPQELEDSAQVDGARDLRIFVSIIVPIAKPLLATIAIFVSVGHWNAWYDSAFFVQNDDLRTLAYRMMATIQRSSTTQGTDISQAGIVSMITYTPLSVQLAAMVLAVFPILAVYPFFQRYIIAGITIGSVKG